MQVEFASRRLAQCYESPREAERTWGVDVARRYRQRVDLLIGADAFALLFSVPPLRLHPLKGDRAGQHAMTLAGRWRLIVTVSPDGRAVRVEEVSHHYDD